MPLTKTLQLTIGNYNIDLGSLDDLGFKLSYTLEEPDNFMSKQGADAQNLTLPATTNNDKAFNTFYNPNTEDLSAGLSFRELMPCLFNVNGNVPILAGYAMLEDAMGTDKPESYNVSIFGANGFWVLDMQAMTLWDCINPNTHTFDLATVQGSWTGYGTTADHDYVYAPVRYRQPFDGTTLGFGGDNCVNIYHLRPSISLLRLIQRAFTQVGFTIKSQFFETDYFKGLVLPWTWGDFYDINSQLVEGVCFQAAGELPTEQPPLQQYTLPVWVGTGTGTTLGTSGGSAWWLAGFNGGFNGGTYTGGVMSIDNGIEYNTVIGTAEVSAGGGGYAVGDTFTITNVFGDLATGTVATVSAGVVLTITITYGGTAYPTFTFYSEGYAAGNICATVATSGGGAGLTILVLTNSVFHPVGTGISLNFNYIFNDSGTSGAGNDHFVMDVDYPPDGYDNFLLYSFIPATGTMQYDFNPPASLAGTMSNISINFSLNLYLVITSGSFAHTLVGLECLHIKASGGNVLTCQSIMPSGLEVGPGSHYPDGSGYPTVPTTSIITVPNCNPGDTLKFRLTALADSTASMGAHTVGVFQACYLNNNPAVIGVPSYAYNPVTEQFGYITPNSIWSPLKSKFTMTGFLIQLGNTVNLKNYDAFRNYQILDMIGGVIDMFNMEVQTDAINKVVTIEPMFGGTLPTGETYDGYFSTTKILDYNSKLDNGRNKGRKVTLFSNTNRQLDLTFKQDGNDGGQNVWAQRYKGIYINNRPYTGGFGQNNIEIDNGIIAGIPGAARYMLPNRFAKGNKQMTNRFFSAVMHCNFPQWVDIDGTTSPAPQLICIFPNDTTSENAYKEVFTPKLAWYAGAERDIADTGGWLWIGDPASPSPITSGGLPLMFAVNYGVGGDTDPVLSYTDENIGGAQLKGLLSQFYRQRFAIMRNGQLVTHNIRLKLIDICNWTHQECLMINNSLYALIQIEDYNPLLDESTACTMWRVVNPQQVDLDNTFPSSASVLSASPATTLGQYDLRYAKLLLYPTDLPQS